MKNFIRELNENRQSIIKATASGSMGDTYKKIVLRPIVLKNKNFWQAERFKGTQVFHLNIAENDLETFVNQSIAPYFKQIDIRYTDKTTCLFIRNKKVAKRTETAAKAQAKPPEEHDRKKRSLLNEGDNIPALVDLGIFTNDFKIVKGMNDKFRQINRFIEIIDDAFAKSTLSEPLTILDFGCGKSYLTFIVYYYFTQIKKIDVKVVGYDLKADVVQKCNEVAQKYGYENLGFYVNDVTKGVPYNGKIDAVISLHACDVATDYAIAHAISNGVKYLFSVPCCQHEINLSIKPSNSRDGDLNILLKYGLIKERAAALLTDSVRAAVLEDFGYFVDVTEFVDFEHTPKNIMLRAVLGAKKKNNKNELFRLKEKYGFSQTLLDLVYKD